MYPSVTLDGSFAVDLPPRDALELFTPEGERGWVPRWDPTYPAGRPEQPEPGTVFVTRAEGTVTTWIVLERTHDRMRYARVAGERTAGSVTVMCRPSDAPGSSEVRVVYELTALGDDGARDVRELSEAYDAFLAGWRAAIREAGADAHP
jgi:hypothetical protein